MNAHELAEVRDLPPPHNLPPAEAQTRARQDWRQSDGSLSGAALGERYGRGARWGRQQIAAARAEDDAEDDGIPPDLPAVPPAPAAAQKTVPPTAAGPERTSAPVPLVVVTVAAVALVATVTAVVSYSHVRDLALYAGMSTTLAAWLPLGLDGLVVASSLSLVIDRHRERPGEPLAKLGVALGLAGSLLANVLAVDPELVSLRAIRLGLAAYPPAALAVAGHLLFRMWEVRK